MLLRVQCLCFKSNKVTRAISWVICVCSICSCLGKKHILGMLFAGQSSSGFGLYACLSGGGRDEGTAHGELLSGLVKLSRVRVAWTLKTC